jgi:Zn-dependent protease
MLLNLISNPQQFIAFVTALLVAITVHEFAHAWMANKLGDPTARLSGRLTMNPLAHLDPLGTIFLFLVGFGWGKPVPINTNNLKNPKIDEIAISLAGPASNLILATVLGLIIRFVPMSSSAINFFVIIITINLVLMTFNLFPIPPLDGSHLLRIVLPESFFELYEQIGIFILIAIVIFSSYIPIISIVVNWVLNLFFNIVIGHSIQI